MFYGAETNARLWVNIFLLVMKLWKRVVKTIAKRTGKDIFRLNSYSDYATLILKDFKSFLSANILPSALPSFYERYVK
jgi:hypothetical protein